MRSSQHVCTAALFVVYILWEELDIRQTRTVGRFTAAGQNIIYEAKITKYNCNLVKTQG